MTSTHLPLIRPPSVTQMPLPSLSLPCGSPASGFACCMVPSPLKTYIWYGNGALGSLTSHAPTIGLGRLFLLGKPLQPFNPDATEARNPVPSHRPHLFICVQSPWMLRIGGQNPTVKTLS